MRTHLYVATCRPQFISTNFSNGRDVGIKAKASWDNAIRLCLLMGIAFLFTGCVTGRSDSTSARGGYYDDWWICVDKCGETDAECVDSCTEDFNKTHSSEGPEPPAFKLRRAIRDDTRHVRFPKKLIMCPENTVPSAFPMPIYDKKGLVVIGYKTVWYCLPEGLEPAR
jgi:hypothetical protein